MRFQFLILFVLSVNTLYGQQIARVSKSSFAKRNPKVVKKSFAQNFILAHLDPKAIAIECFRSKFCTQITQHVSKDEYVVHNRLFSVNKYAAAKFSWDVISYAFIQAMKGKEIDQIWYPAFNQACTTVAQHRVAQILCMILPKRIVSKEEQNHLRVQLFELFKDTSRSLIALGVVAGTKAYVVPVIKKQGLDLLQSIFFKKINGN